MELISESQTLQRRHNGHDSVSNHQPHDSLLNRLFRRRSKKKSKLRVTGLCAGIHRRPVNSPHKWPVTRKMFPFDDVIMGSEIWTLLAAPEFLILTASGDKNFKQNYDIYWYGTSSHFDTTFVTTVVARTLSSWQLANGKNCIKMAFSFSVSSFCIFAEIWNM